ncbi:hypothetical protein BU25DRAFT_409003 [Macroventuria anomochaeta]|uniref:Uncharacterized protein n=1 Tax=Macroventuria anomochaeta TaxID=301207 RepID=A0ACB6S9F3_9PLEO|nr:uncharacterized protein BU25DRAFT_409003 [Macroventuria anomochaeta]KAF2629737.1 hypothetical protein BU25DRAFT_409003 [Macroventuria anomochaeta]
MVQEEFGDHAKDLHTYTSIANLYTRLSTLMFEASGLTKLHWWFYLSIAFNQKRIGRLPSWVPDLHNNDAKSKRQPYESMIAVRGDPPWQASSRPCGASHGPQPGETILRGKLLDKFMLMHPEVSHFPDDPAPSDGTGMIWMAALVDLIRWESEVSDAVLQGKARGFIRAASDESEKHSTSEDTYWRALVAGVLRRHHIRYEIHA